MKKKTKVKIFVLMALFIVAFLIAGCVTCFEYTKNHIMVYSPTDEEQVRLAHDMGLILSSDVHIDAAMLWRARGDADSGYSVRLTGVYDTYIFLTENINIIDSVREEGGTIYINENPVLLDNQVVTYDGSQTYRGFETTVNVTGKKEPNGTREFEYPCKLTFFFNDNDELLFVECGFKHVPYGDSFYEIEKRHYWNDYVFYPLLPLFK